jgi:hypothetical protein
VGPRFQPRLLLPVACLALAAGIGCSEAVRGLGADRDAARRHADDLAASLAARFGPTSRDPVFDALRPVLARYALVPSRIFDAPALWTNAQGATRGIAFRGQRARGLYEMSVDANPPAPSAVADYRGEWRLERLREDEFEWMVREELAVGGAAPEDLARALTALFRAAESASETDPAPRLRAEMPRTTAALGRLVALEGLVVRHEPGGGVILTLTASLHPDGIRSFAPRYAHYLDDVVTPTRFAASASDDAGARWWEINFADGRLTVRFRPCGGDLAPLAGSPRAIPERLHVRMSGSSKTGFLRSGFHDLEVDVELVRRSDEKGFVARFTRAPAWDLPILVPLLLRPALRRPFEGHGAFLSFGARAGAGGPTRLARTYRVAVRENWLLRWFGGYVAGAVNSYRLGEVEADRFNAEVILALREDALALVDQR